ncbi:hypothetical protein AKJ42_02340 [candidate division MSBL1 archaeon SCGC-AAA261C02]|uniref:Uncharacterized protein n=1 Tax=candidate division MSBL1 archaeon SCGC-AAA261C02 TaxID=1698272 RepID=A0A133V0B8_9EURY|nr:hypothetical protein AKJ42_02340 [candidate division MSBL1 archaeon SCGC-AAA261C02]
MQRFSIVLQVDDPNYRTREVAELPVMGLVEPVMRRIDRTGARISVIQIEPNEQYYPQGGDEE